MDYNPVGTCLLNDIDGAIMKVIERDHRYYTKYIMDEVFDRWIRREYQEGEGHSNTWQTLVKCLRFIQMNTLADDIEGVLRYCIENPDNCRHRKIESTSLEVSRMEISYC